MNPELVPKIERATFRHHSVIASPTGTHLRLTNEEAAIFEALDGTRSLRELIAQFGPETGSLVTDLRDGGFLVDSPPAAKSGRWMLTRQGIEYRGGNNFVGRLHRVLRPAFTPTGASALVAFAAVGVVVFLLGEPWNDTELVVNRVTPVAAVAILLVLGMATDIFHELGHAITARHFGRKIGGFGIGFYWGAPSFFVDASETLFLPRRARVIQALAGVFVEFVLAAGAVFATLLVEPGVVESALLTFATLSFLGGIFNLSPILDLDGYWVMADSLDRPLLRQDAHAALMRRLSGKRIGRDMWLVAYLAISWSIGVVLLVSSFGVWWVLFGDIFFELWHGGLAHKALAVWWVLPQAGIALHALGVVVAALAGWLLRRKESGKVAVRSQPSGNENMLPGE